MNPRIIKIEKKKTKYNLVIKKDDEFYNFSITEELLIDSKFLTLKEISDDEFKNFLSKLPYDSLLLEALNYISKSIKSKKEIKDHLFEFTSSENLINRVISELENKGLVNDYEYFKFITDYYMNSKKDGTLKIEAKLKELGLNFKFYYDVNILKENIKELVVKYDRKLNNVPFKMKIDKTKKYLYSKGYTLDEIEKYFNSSFLKNSNNEEELIVKDLDKLKEKYNDDTLKIKLSLIAKGYKKEIVEKYVK